MQPCKRTPSPLPSSLAFAVIIAVLSALSVASTASVVSKRSVNFTPSWGKRSFAPAIVGDDLDDLSVDGGGFAKLARGGSEGGLTRCAAEARMRVDALARRLRMEMQALETCLRFAPPSSLELSNLN